MAAPTISGAEVLLSIPESSDQSPPTPQIATTTDESPEVPIASRSISSTPDQEQEALLVDTAGQSHTTPEEISNLHLTIPGGHPTTPSRAHQALYESDSESESDSDGNSEAYDDDDDDDDMDPLRWEAIVEDKSLPCEDELKYIESREEHSALDHAHWQKEADFESDAQIRTIEQNRIDWLVENFNGTAENPNTEQIMRSPIVRIGGYEWQLKFYPRGDKSDYLSMYVECVSMLAPDFAATEDFDDPPFPFLEDLTPRLKQRRSVAAQFCVIIYNPAEPRVCEAKFECHQFHKDRPDHGWKYFSDYPRNEMYLRQHGQRQAILRDDKLAFSAHIRVVEDESRAMWEHTEHAGGSVLDSKRLMSITGLRPWYDSTAYGAACNALLHFKPFRDIIRTLDVEAAAIVSLRKMLLKMYARKSSRRHRISKFETKHDVMEVFWTLSHQMPKNFENRPDILKQYREIMSASDIDSNTTHLSNRLMTSKNASIQAAINNHSSPLECTALLILELQRQEHDKKDRKWKKLMTKVEVQDEIVVSQHKYTLFAFITHVGQLHSRHYNTYVRPRGINNGWYAYTRGGVTRLTEHRARLKHSGRSKDIEDGSRSSYEDAYDDQEVTQVVLYIREDYVEAALGQNVEEAWSPIFAKQEQKQSPTTPPPELAENLPLTAKTSKNPSAAAEELPSAPSWPPGQENHVEIVSDASHAVEDTASPEHHVPHTENEDVIMHDSERPPSSQVAEENLVEMTDVQKHAPAEDTGVVMETREWLGQTYYHGESIDGKAEGHGHEICTNGDEYVGSFHAGVYHGQGKMIFSETGDIYEGAWSEGVQHGQGKLTEASTGNIFEGGWKAGKKHGSFVLRGEVTEDDRSLCSICYENEIAMAFNCGHVVTCTECATQLDICPLCRKPVYNRLQLFGVKISMA